MLRLTYERLKMGLSKAELARRSKIDQGLISKIENGRVIPYRVELERIGKVLKIPEEKLLEVVNQDGDIEGCEKI